MKRFHSYGLCLAVALGLSAPALTQACELDGMSHGYGPMSALFAGAHRYQSLNGLDDEPPPPPPPPVVSEDVAAPVAAAAVALAVEPNAAANEPDPSASAVTPRRSFASWAKAAPKPANTEDAPAAWASGATSVAEASESAGASASDSAPKP